MIFSSIPFSVDLKALLKDAHIDAEDEELVSTVQRIATNAEAVAAPKAVISPAPLLQKNGRISQIGDHAVCGELFDYIVSVASGERQTKTEQNGARDFCIYRSGVTL